MRPSSLSLSSSHPHPQARSHTARSPAESSTSSSHAQNRLLPTEQTPTHSHLNQPTSVALPDARLISTNTRTLSTETSANPQLTERVNSISQDLYISGRWTPDIHYLAPQLLVRLPQWPTNLALHILNPHQQASAFYFPPGYKGNRAIALLLEGNHYQPFTQHGTFNIMKDGDSLYRSIILSLSPAESIQLVGNTYKQRREVETLRAHLAQYAKHHHKEIEQLLLNADHAHPFVTNTYHPQFSIPTIHPIIPCNTPLTIASPSLLNNTATSSQPNPSHDSQTAHILPPSTLPKISSDIFKNYRQWYLQLPKKCRIDPERFQSAQQEFLNKVGIDKKQLNIYIENNGTPTVKGLQLIQKEQSHQFKPIDALSLMGWHTKTHLYPKEDKETLAQFAQTNNFLLEELEKFCNESNNSLTIEGAAFVARHLSHQKPTPLLLLNCISEIQKALATHPNQNEMVYKTIVEKIAKTNNLYLPELQHYLTSTGQLTTLGKTELEPLLQSIGGSVTAIENILINTSIPKSPTIDEDLNTLTRNVNNLLSSTLTTDNTQLSSPPSPYDSTLTNTPHVPPDLPIETLSPPQTVSIANASAVTASAKSSSPEPQSIHDELIALAKNIDDLLTHLVKIEINSPANTPLASPLPLDQEMVTLAAPMEMETKFNNPPSVKPLPILTHNLTEDAPILQTHQGEALFIDPNTIRPTKGTWDCLRPAFQDYGIDFNSRERLEITRNIIKSMKEWIKDEGQHRQRFDKCLSIERTIDRGDTLFAKTTIPTWTVLGPYSGVLVSEGEELEHLQKQYGEKNIQTYLYQGGAISGPDKDKVISGFRASNRLSLINDATLANPIYGKDGQVLTNNVAPVRIGNTVFLVTTTEIPKDTELFLSYGEEYRKFYHQQQTLHFKQESISSTDNHTSPTVTSSPSIAAHASFTFNPGKRGRISSTSSLENNSKTQRTEASEEAPGALEKNTPATSLIDPALAHLPLAQQQHFHYLSAIKRIINDHSDKSTISADTLAYLHEFTIELGKNMALAPDANMIYLQCLRTYAHEAKIDATSLFNMLTQVTPNQNSSYLKYLRRAEAALPETSYLAIMRGAILLLHTLSDSLTETPETKKLLHHSAKLLYKKLRNMDKALSAEGWHIRSQKREAIYKVFFQLAHSNILNEKRIDRIEKDLEAGAFTFHKGKSKINRPAIPSRTNKYPVPIQSYEDLRQTIQASRSKIWQSLPVNTENTSHHALINSEEDNSILNTHTLNTSDTPHHTLNPSITAIPSHEISTTKAPLTKKERLTRARAYPSTDKRHANIKLAASNQRTSTSSTPDHKVLNVAISRMKEVLSSVAQHSGSNNHPQTFTAPPSTYPIAHSSTLYIPASLPINYPRHLSSPNTSHHHPYLQRNETRLNINESPHAPALKTPLNIDTTAIAGLSTQRAITEH